MRGNINSGPRLTSDIRADEAMNASRNQQQWKTTPFDLTGKVAIITGSSRGIGRSIAEQWRRSAPRW